MSQLKIDFSDTPPAGDIVQAYIDDRWLDVVIVQYPVDGKEPWRRMMAYSVQLPDGSRCYIWDFDHIRPTPLTVGESSPVST